MVVHACHPRPQSLKQQNKVGQSQDALAERENHKAPVFPPLGGFQSPSSPLYRILPTTTISAPFYHIKIPLMG